MVERENSMPRNLAIDTDNRPANEMYTYYEARVDALKRRIAELEEHNRNLLSEVIAMRKPYSPPRRLTKVK
jgi:hypothetical protein